MLFNLKVIFKNNLIYKGIQVKYAKDEKIGGSNKKYVIADKPQVFENQAIYTVKESKKQVVREI